MDNTKKVILKNLKGLMKIEKNKLIEDRYQKYRKIGKGVEYDFKG